MSRLLRANLWRLKKSKTFWASILISFVFAAIFITYQYTQLVKFNASMSSETIVLSFPMLLSIILSIFTSLFIGVEYTDGGNRNKISTGHKRRDIYLANLLTTVLVSVLLYVLYTGIILLIGVPLLGKFQIPMAQFGIYYLCTLLIATAYSSLFTLIAMCISNKTLTAVTTLMLAFGLLLAGLATMNALQAPKTIQTANMKDGEIELTEMPNPRYPSEKKRKMLEILFDINPGGQACQFAEGKILHLKRMPIYSLAVVVLTTGLGLAIFNKKELK